MDPRDRADAALARARARGAYVVTPEDAVSPMDATNTLQIPRSVVQAADSHLNEADSTMVIPAGMARGQSRQPDGRPQDSRPQDGRSQDGRQPGHQSGHHQPVAPPSVAPQQFSGNGQQGRPGPQQQQQQPGQQWAATPPVEPEEPPAPRELGGLVPTVHQPGTQRSTMSRRLDGQ